jgi:hypothetical protein
MRLHLPVVAAIVAMLPVSCGADQGRPPPLPPTIEPVLAPFATAEFKFPLPDTTDRLVIQMRSKRIPTEPTVAIDRMQFSLGNQSIDVDPDLLADVRDPGLWLEATMVRDSVDGHRVVAVYIFDAFWDCATREPPPCGVVEYEWDIENHSVRKIDDR